MQTLREYFKGCEHGERVRLAKKVGITKEALYERTKNGWRVGKVNGKKAMYNPKQVTFI